MKNLILRSANFAAKVLPEPIKKSFYKFTVIQKLFQVFLNTASPDELREVIITSGPAKGLSMIVNLRNEKGYWLGTYEYELQDAARKLIKPGDIVYDIGANIGGLSIIFSLLTGDKGKVFAFEALPANVERLKNHISINKLDDQISVIDKAVVDINRPVTFLTAPYCYDGTVLDSADDNKEYSGKISIKGISLDSFITEKYIPEPEVIKIDIEGGEVNALAGMQRVLSEVRPTFIIALHQTEVLQQVWDQLLKHKYSLYKIRKPFRRITNSGSLQKFSQIIALPEEKSSLLT